MPVLTRPARLLQLSFPPRAASARSTRGSSNGRTPDSGSGYQGSNPCPRTQSSVREFESYDWPHGLAVRTAPSHGVISGSSPDGVTTFLLALPPHSPWPQAAHPPGRCPTPPCTARGETPQGGSRRQRTALHVAAESLSPGLSVPELDSFSAGLGQREDAHRRRNRLIRRCRLSTYLASAELYQ
jgi:hypothetical protein